MSVSGDRKRKELLAEMVRVYVFQLMDTEFDFDGMDAGFIARECEKAFKTAYGKIINLDDGILWECESCGVPFTKEESELRGCPECGGNRTHPL